MSDDFDKNLDLGDTGEPAGGKIKTPGAGRFKALLGLFKWIGIGLGAVILITVIVVITVSILNKQSKPMTEMPSSEDYQRATPRWATFTSITQVSTNTIDAEPWAIIVKVNLAYDIEDKEIQTELTDRKYQIQDFLRNFFSSKPIAELLPDRERILKEELRNKLNEMLSKPAVKDIYFEDFRRTQL
jgi:flagellar FliL protein